MRNTIKCTLQLLMVCIAMSLQAQEIEKKSKELSKPKIALLGMFHLAGSSEDLAAIKMEDPLGNKRQKEIIEVVTALKKYRPTKIMVEYPKSRSTELNNKYSNYLADKDTLSVSETYQIGFRLARQLNHNKIYAIDYKLALPMEEVVSYCKKTNKMNEFQNFIENIKAMMNGETQKLEKITLIEYLSFLNTDSIDRKANEVYLKDILEFSDSTSQAGIEVSATWRKRNMIIFNNISETIETDKEERILVIIGAAHRAVIKDFVQDRDDMQYVEIAKYLMEN